jgi:hypothetical protein
VSDNRTRRRGLPAAADDPAEARLQRQVDSIACGDAAALADLTLQAVAGDVAAARTLGRVWFDGLAGAHDRARALAWLRRAAERDDAVAARDLAIALMEDRDAGAGDREVLHWLGRAMDLGDLGAMAVLGASMVRVSDPAEQLQGAALLHQAAEGGEEFALKQLAWCYQRGRGVDRNPELAYTLLLIAERMGHSVGRFDVTCAGALLTEAERTSAEHRAEAWWRRGQDPTRMGLG